MRNIYPASRKHIKKPLFTSKFFSFRTRRSSETSSSKRFSQGTTTSVHRTNLHMQPFRISSWQTRFRCFASWATVKQSFYLFISAALLISQTTCGLSFENGSSDKTITTVSSAPSRHTKISLLHHRAFRKSLLQLPTQLFHYFLKDSFKSSPHYISLFAFPIERDFRLQNKTSCIFSKKSESLLCLSEEKQLNIWATESSKKCRKL